MAPRIEWRTRGETNDVLLFVDNDKVQRAREATPPMLVDFLNNMEALRREQDGAPAQEAGSDPAAYGPLVMSRATTGEIIDMDPERYWDAIYFWFRSRGTDPHHMETHAGR